MNTADIVIIGAGAAGLMAARELASAGKKVIVLEAQDRTGGRIHTHYKDSSLKHVELGAEFVHGDLPVTLGLLNKAGIKYSQASAAMYRYAEGTFTTNENFIENWDLLIDKLNKLKQDTDINRFMLKEFPGDKYEGMRDSVRQFVSGYDTADPEKASCFALRKEWQNEDEQAQYRIDGGYAQLMNYMANECKANAGQIYLNAIVKDIYWEPGKVRIITTEGATYHAEKVILAIPPGVLQAGDGEKGAVTFYPPVKAQQEAMRQIGFGTVIKIVLEFDEAFWESKQTEEMAGKSLENMGYLFSAEEIPTWWTQFPAHSTVFTGWIGGPDADAKKSFSDDMILKEGLQSVANIFKLSVDELKKKLKSWYVINWTARPFTRGSYAYDMVNTPLARKTLNTPVSDTLFFTGEYLYEGPAMGTVEAALTSGRDVAKVINYGRQ